MNEKEEAIRIIKNKKVDMDSFLFYIHMYDDYDDKFPMDEYNQWVKDENRILTKEEFSFLRNNIDLVKRKYLINVNLEFTVYATCYGEAIEKGMEYVRDADDTELYRSIGIEEEELE